MNALRDLPAMDLLRSEQMCMVQLIIPVQSAHGAITYLGELGLLQFRDVKRCGEMARKLHFFKDQINKAGLSFAANPIMSSAVDLEVLEVQLAEHETELLEINANSEKLHQTYNELIGVQDSI